jgi:hypothetical protein
LSLPKIRSLWQNVRARAESARPSLNATLSHTAVSAFENGVLTLGVPHRTNAELLRRDLPTLRSALDGVLGRSLEIRIAVENGRSAAPPASEAVGDEPADLVRYAIEKLPS